MAELKQMCVDEGFDDVKTYIASGNVVFASGASPTGVQIALEDRLAEYFGKPCSVFVRSADEMSAILAANPFPDAPGKWTHVVFLEAPPPKDTIGQVRFRTTEQIALGTREIYIAYRDGMGRSKLKVPAAEKGTARNVNTVAKLAELAAERSSR